MIQWLILALNIAEIVAVTIKVNSKPVGASKPISEPFVAFSIEFSSFPDFAGNISSPNKFSDNLLNNLKHLSGAKPYIRVGGNTQDYALYNPKLPYALNGTVNPARSPDYPTTIYIGPSYFESYQTWPDTKFVHGFNLGLGGNNSAGWETLIKTVPLACKALGNKLLWWEYGNEPDLFSTSAQGPVRPPSWNEAQYVSQWLNGTRAIKNELAKACPEMLSSSKYGYLAPSFAGTNNHLKPLKTWTSGLNVDKDIKLFSSHNYIGGATQLGVTLQGTLMNHSRTVLSISSQLALLTSIKTNSSPPFILGETNSLYNQGRPGLSDTFGAALWGIDFNLWSATQNISRVHMHQGTNYRYAAWQPIESALATQGTKAPYYGSVFVAAFVGNVSKGASRIANLPLESPFEAAYAAYEAGVLQRIAVVNMRGFNYTASGGAARLSHKYSFAVGNVAEVRVQRLLANGSNAITGITWDGWSYNWELNQGKQVRLGNVTTGERVNGSAGLITVDVLDSSAVILNLGSGE